MTDNVYRLRPLATEDEEALPPAFTEEALALRFAETHTDDLRYVAAWGKWYIWTGTQWREDARLRSSTMPARFVALRRLSAIGPISRAELLAAKRSLLLSV